MSMFTSDDEIVSGHLSDRSEEKSDISSEDDSWSDHSDCSFSMSEHVHSTSLSCSDQSCLSTSNNTTTSISDISTGDRDEEKTSPQDNTKSNCGFSEQGKKQSICNACKVIRFGKAQNNVKRLKKMKCRISELIQLLQ